MQSYPSPSIWNCRKISFPQILPHKGKEFKASFLLNAQLSFPVNPSAHGEGVKLSSPEIQSYGEGIKLSLLPKCTGIPHMGKESKPGVRAILFHKFFPKMQSYPSPQFYKSFPFCMKGMICPHHAEPLQILPHKLIFIISFICFPSFFILCLFHFILFLFFFLFFFFYFFFFFFFFFFSFSFLFSKLEILPQRRKFIPQHLAGIIEE